MPPIQPAQKKHPKAVKYLGQTGYTLHASRFSYTGMGVMRSIKFPLYHSERKVYDTFCQQIISDYKLVQGATNLESFLVDEQSYSLIDFWVDSLRAGVVFQPTEAQMSAFLRQHYQMTDVLEIAFSNMDRELRDKLDYLAFRQKIMLSTGLRPTSKFPGFLKCFKPDLQKDEAVIQLANQIFNHLVHDGVALTQSEQKEYWLSNWKLNLPEKSSTGESSTFFILPELQLAQDMTVGQCLDQRRQLFPDQMLTILGFENTFSAFSNYYGKVITELRSGDVENIEKTIKSMSSSWQGNEVELKKRLEFLSARAQLLPVSYLAKYPDYRTSFGGKLQGWYSNYEAQIKRIGEQIGQFGEAIQKAIDDVRVVGVHENDVGFQESHEQRKSVLLTNLDQLKQLQLQLADADNRDFVTLELFRDLLSYVRTDLNWIYQTYLQTDKEKKEEKMVESRYRGLFVKLKLVPEFFGDSRKKQFAKYRDQVVPILRDGQAIVDKLKTELLTSPDYSFVDQQFFVKQLQKLLDKLQTKSWNTKKYQQMVEEVVKKYNNGLMPGRQQAFFLSPYARNKHCKVIQIGVSLDWGSELSDLIKQLNHNFSLDQNPTELQDWLETQKWLIGWLLRANPNLEIDSAEWPTQVFTKARTFQQQFGTKLSGGGRNYFVNSLIFSEMRGAASSFSRREITMRYVVQPIASLNKYPLVLKTKQENPDLKDKHGLVNQPHRWYLASQKLIRKKESTSESEVGLVTEDEHGKRFGFLRSAYFDPGTLLEIRTSKYQIHFLDRLLYAGRKWRDLDVTASDHSLIVEDTYRVNWNLQTGQPGVQKIDENRRLYVSVPVNIKPVLDKDEKKVKKQAIKDGRQRYLGIDVGEYGLAWVVLDFASSLNPRRIAQGFIFNQSLRKIKDKAEEIKDTQVTGTFTVPSTKLARVRENAITSLRNQVHDLVIKYNAKPIYEHSISNFETGSNKTTKIYRSVKVSDVVAENPADDAVKSHVWGSKYITVGNHISSYATSYTCSQCHQSIYDQGLESQSEVKRHVVKEIYGRVIIVQLANNRAVYGYVPPKRDEVCFPYHTGSQLSDKEVYTLVKNFARPPLDKSEAVSFVKNKKPNQLPEKELSLLQESRGNSSIFICPFVNCLHVADADMQAAQNIALRGYLKDQEPESIRKKREKNREAFDYMGAVNMYFKTVKLESMNLEIRT